MALTVLGLVDHVLFQSGLDSGYRARARTWLNIVRDKLANNTDYRFYRKSATVPYVAGQNEYDLASDFLRADSAFQVNSAGAQGAQIFIFEPYAFDASLLGMTGDPTAATIDEKRRKIVFNNKPGSGTTSSYLLNYFFKPTDYDTAGADDSLTPDFPNQNVLIQEMILLAYEAQDDQRYATKYQEAERANQKHQINMYQSDGTGVIPLSQLNYRARPRRR